MVWHVAGKDKKEINGSLGRMSKGQCLTQIQNNVLHQHNSHLVMYGVGTGSSILRIHMCSTY